MREEGGSALERALLEAGRSAGASPRTRSRALAALGMAAGPMVVVAGPTQAASVIAAASEAAPAPVASSVSAFTATTATTTAALSTKVGLTTTLAKVVVGVTLAGAVAAVPLGTMAWRRAHAPVAVSTENAKVDRVVSAPTRESFAPPVAEPAPTGPGLGRELAALDVARIRLGKGDLAGATASLDEYGRRFPRGRLAMEAEVLRIDALARGGRTEAAHTRAAAFLRDHPGSVLTSRVRRYLAD